MIARTAGGVTTQYRWSDKNSLLERKVAGVTAERSRYDAGGIRERKSDGSKYFSSGAVSVADMRPSNVPVSYFQGHQLLGMEVDGDFYFYVTDGLANVRLVLDSNGTTVASTVFDEFGIPEDVSGSADLRPHGYTGGLGVRNDWDSSGLHYMRQRYYDPQLGRWLSADPIGFDGGLNLYSYVGQNPTNRVDPAGLQETDATSTSSTSSWDRFVQAIRGTFNRKNLKHYGKSQLEAAATMGMIIPPIFLSRGLEFGLQAADIGSILQEFTDAGLELSLHAFEHLLDRKMEDMIPDVVKIAKGKGCVKLRDPVTGNLINYNDRLKIAVVLAENNVNKIVSLLDYRHRRWVPR